MYPTTPVHPDSVLFHPREIQIVWSQTTVKRSKPNTRLYQGKTNEVLRSVPGTRTQKRQTIKEEKKGGREEKEKKKKDNEENIKRTAGVLKNVMKKHKKGEEGGHLPEKHHMICVEEERVPFAQGKRHEE